MDIEIDKKTKVLIHLNFMHLARKFAKNFVNTKQYKFMSYSTNCAKRHELCLVFTKSLTNIKASLVSHHDL